MCEEIRELGFADIEVSHGLSLSLLPGVIAAVESGRIRVAGVHNFCPAPIEVKGDVPDAYRFTSHRESDRERAMRLTEETLMAAERLGARYVVLHMGEVELFQGHEATRTLQRMARHGHGQTLQEKRPSSFEKVSQTVNQTKQCRRKGNQLCDAYTKKLHSIHCRVLLS